MTREEFIANLLMLGFELIDNNSTTNDTYEHPVYGRVYVQQKCEGWDLKGQIAYLSIKVQDWAGAGIGSYIHHQHFDSALDTVLRAVTRASNQREQP